MTYASQSKDEFFTPFEESIAHYSLPNKFTYPFNYTPHPLCLLAAKQLQTHLKNQQEWEHNFGLTEGKKGTIIGKMFGILVVKTQNNELGYLAAFSGKLAGSNHHKKFVPPVFDMLTEGSFLNVGMAELSRINNEIKSLEAEKSEIAEKKIASLKSLRKNNSINLQGQIFDNYRFLNQAGEEKSLRAIFKKKSNNNPPSGAGECAAPKLLQYAFAHHMKPIAIAEFWWGLSPKSNYWKHEQFYPACKEKCEPILSHMLAGIKMDKKPAQK